jgi:hypothetical protein
MAFAIALATHSGPVVADFKATAKVVKQLRPRTDALGPLYLLELSPQTAANRDGTECQLPGQALKAVLTKKCIDDGLSLFDGDDVVVLVRPSDPNREGRVIYKRERTWGRR